MKKKIMALLSMVALTAALSLTAFAADNEFPSLDSEFYPGTETTEVTTETTTEPSTTKIKVPDGDGHYYPTPDGGTTTKVVTNTVKTDVSTVAPKTGESMAVIYIGAIGVALAGVAYSARRRIYEIA